MVSLFHSDLRLTDSSDVVGTPLPISEPFLRGRERGCSKNLSDRLLDLGIVTREIAVLFYSIQC